jgi:hydroxypyruvate isomerase
MVKPSDVPLEPFIEQVAQIGFPAIELWARDASFPEFAVLAHKYHLAISCMTGHDSLPVGLNDPSQHERIERELRASIDVAAGEGIPNLICFSGNRRPGLSDEEGIAFTAQGFERIAPYAEQKSITLVLELLNSRLDHPGYQCDHSAWGLAVCQRVNSPRVRLLFDIYHMQIMEGDLVQTISDHIDWIGHFHTAGVPGRRDIDGTQEINYARVAQAISQSTYQGYVAHEYRPLGDLYASMRTTFAICNQ